MIDQNFGYELGVGGTPGIYLRYSTGEIVRYEGGRTLEDFGRMIEEGKHGKPDKENEA